MKTSEKRLLFIMLGIALLGGLVVGSGKYFDKRDELRTGQRQLSSEWDEIQALFTQRETWEMRSNWLEANQPKFTSPEKAAGEIFQEAQASEVEGVEATKQVFVDPEETPHYIQTGVSLSAKGELPNVMRWIYDLSRPEDFRIVRNLKIVPDKETPENVIATFELLRWYAPTNQ
ncbi:MAG: hypothetical protein P1U87_06175 [Verrucomicrobiales bacterium]|nr:hypothetical protein [Verrucomicrobiales bacterium]